MWLPFLKCMICESSPLLVLMLRLDVGGFHLNLLSFAKTESCLMLEF
jgi:hypothetical protein